MAQPNETTRLLPDTSQQYLFDSSINRERKRKVKQFQCCLCAIFLSVVLVAIIITVIYSIEHDNHVENSTDTSTAADILALTPALILLSKAWPIPDVDFKNETINKKYWEECLEAGERGLLMKDEIENHIPSLLLQSPSFRHQMAIATSERARNLSKIGFVEEYATQYFNKNHSGQINKICPKMNESLPMYYERTTQCNTFQRFRSYNGTCNNLKYPDTFGVAYRPFRRALPPDYADGISQPRTSKYFKSLPSARKVSLVVHYPYLKQHSKFTVMLAIWGQFLDHDITATAISKKSNGSTISCCKNGNKTSPECFPVILNPDDPFQQYNVTCLEFVRSSPAPTNCLGPREQLNQATAYIDASVIYGRDKDTAKKLRDLKNGTMKVYVTKDGRHLLPLSDDLNDGCNREDEEKMGRYCFMTGDSRANENLHLTTMHLLWLRQHNNIAKKLSSMNPHWNDERIFQEVRRIIIAQMQHITYNEFLPILLGQELMRKSELNPRREGYSTQYNENIDPNIANNFATASFRFAHSIIPSVMKLLSSRNSTPDYIQMHKMLFNPFELYKPGELDRTIRGALNTSTEPSDSYFTNELKSHMFERETEKIAQSKLCGLDLVALNIQRGRDHGLPSYPHWRKHCGFKSATNFSSLKHDMDPKSLENIQAIYSSVEDVDLYTGALSEKPLDGSILGPTLTCLIHDQFYRIKHGDRFWFETNQHPQAFTQDQLDEIRKTTLAEIICDNSDNLEFIQPKVMEQLGPRNDYMPCNSTHRLNLKYWKENLHLLKLSRNENENILHLNG